jgi:ABC-2 type transport system ATP-binding protein
MATLEESASPEAATLAEEVAQFVAEDELRQAINCLLDFAKKFGEKTDINAAVLHSQELTSLDKHGRTIGRDEAYRSRRSALAIRLLECRDHILTTTTAQTGPPLAADPPGGTGPAAVTVSFLSLEDAVTQQQRRQEEKYKDRPTFRGINVAKTYGRRGGFRLTGVTLDLAPGTITGVVGSNSSGKTTLLRIVAGDLAADDPGAVRYPDLRGGNPGNPKKAPDWYLVRRRISYVPQEPQSWPCPLRAALQFWAAEHGFQGEDNQEEVNFILERMGLRELLDYEWRQLSGGMKMRVELARVWLRRPRLIVLDEPLAPLDPFAQFVFLRDLRAMADRSPGPVRPAILLSSQHIPEVETIADQMLLLEDGCPLFCGSRADVGKERTENTFEVCCDQGAEHVRAALALLPGAVAALVGANTFLIRTPMTVSGRDFIEVFLGAGLELKGFRDLSRSTRSLLGVKPFSGDDRPVPPKDS